MTNVSTEDQKICDQKTWVKEVGRNSIFPPTRVQIRRNSLRQLVITVDKKWEWVGVKPIRAFPLSTQAELISFLDDKDTEVVLLSNPDQLDSESLEALQSELSRYYSVPKVIRVHRILAEHGVVQWQVETDRGYAEIEVTDREQMRRLSAVRVILVDVDGNRYEIEDFNKLDARSRAWIEKEI